MTVRPGRPMGRTGLLIGIGLFLSVGAAWLAIQGVDLDMTLEIIGRSDVVWLAVAVGVIACQVILRSIRWRLILPESAGGRVRVIRILPVMLVGYLANAVLPARLGEGVRAVLLARRESLSTAETVGSVVLERALDLLTLAILGSLAAVAIGLAGDSVIVVVIGLVVAAGAVALLAFAPRLVAGVRWRRLAGVRALLDRLLSGADITGRLPTIGAALVPTVASWLLDASIYWLVARSLGVDLSPLAAVVLSAVAVLSTAIPAAPGYVGTYELAAAGAARALGIDPATALAFALVAHALTVIPIGLAGAVAAIAMSRGGLQSSAPGRQTALNDSPPMADAP
jgi:uncharacterized membrane protein YbhN (UPF0104 family)